MTLKKYGKRMK